MIDKKEDKNYTVTIPEWLMNNTNIDTTKFEKLVKESAGKFDDEVKGLIEVIKGFYEEALKRAEKTVVVRRYNNYNNNSTEIIRTIGLEEVREMLLPEIKEELEDKYISEIKKLKNKNKNLEERIKDINNDLIQLENKNDSYLNKKIAEIRANYDRDLIELQTYKLSELAKAKENVKNQIVQLNGDVRKLVNSRNALQNELDFEKIKNRELQQLLQKLNPDKKGDGFFKRLWNKVTSK